jgi:hypothetical protein
MHKHHPDASDLSVAKSGVRDFSQPLFFGLPSPHNPGYSQVTYLPVHKET